MSPGASGRRSRLDAQADGVIRYFERRAKRGYFEAHRTFLYAPAMIPPGTWNADEWLDVVIRRAKDLGADAAPPFELVPVYARAGWWTCQPSVWVRDWALIMELRRESGAQERWSRIAADRVVSQVAASNVATLDAGAQMLIARSPEAEPSSDPVLTRIDAIAAP